MDRTGTLNNEKTTVSVLSKVHSSKHVVDARMTKSQRITQAKPLSSRLPNLSSNVRQFQYAVHLLYGLRSRSCRSTGLVAPPCVQDLHLVVQPVVHPSACRGRGLAGAEQEEMRSASAHGRKKAKQAVAHEMGGDAAGYGGDLEQGK